MGLAIPVQADAGTRGWQIPALPPARPSPPGPCGAAGGRRDGREAAPVAPLPKASGGLARVKCRDTGKNGVGAFYCSSSSSPRLFREILFCFFLFLLISSALTSQAGLSPPRVSAHTQCGGGAEPGPRCARRVPPAAPPHPREGRNQMGA